MTENIETSFCFACGDYLRPDLAEVAWIENGIVRCVCRDCKRTIYAARIDEAVSKLNLKKRPSGMPLFEAISG